MKRVQERHEIRYDEELVFKKRMHSNFQYIRVRVGETREKLVGCAWGSHPS